MMERIPAPEVRREFVTNPLKGGTWPLSKKKESNKDLGSRGEGDKIIGQGIKMTRGEFNRQLKIQGDLVFHALVQSTVSERIWGERFS